VIRVDLPALLSLFTFGMRFAAIAPACFALLCRNECPFEGRCVCRLTRLLRGKKSSFLDVGAGEHGAVLCDESRLWRDRSRVRGDRAKEPVSVSDDLQSRGPSRPSSQFPHLAISMYSRTAQATSLANFCELRTYFDAGPEITDPTVDTRSCLDVRRSSCCVVSNSLSCCQYLLIG